MTWRATFARPYPVSESKPYPPPPPPYVLSVLESPAPAAGPTSPTPPPPKAPPPVCTASGCSGASPGCGAAGICWSYVLGTCRSSPPENGECPGAPTSAGPAGCRSPPPPTASGAGRADASAGGAAAVGQGLARRGGPHPVNYRTAIFPRWGYW